MALSFDINIYTEYFCETKLRLRVSDRKGKHAQESLYLQGIFSYINERDTSSLYCKYKHMLLKMELDHFTITKSYPQSSACQVALCGWLIIILPAMSTYKVI